jgi:hypothetical protein
MLDNVVNYVIADVALLPSTVDHDGRSDAGGAFNSGAMGLPLRWHVGK